MSAETRRTIAKASSEPIHSTAAADPSEPFAVTDPPEYVSSAGSGYDSSCAADSPTAARMVLAICESAPGSAATHA